MKIVITLDIDEFYKDEILNNVVRLDFICADKTVIERDEFTLKPMPYKKIHIGKYNIWKLTEEDKEILIENRGYNKCIAEIQGE